MNIALDFLTELFEEGLSYSTVNTARCALSSLLLPVDNVTFGCQIVVIRFMKGVFNLRPPVSRYCATWDVDIVLRFLRTLSPVKELSFKDVTLKLVMLMALISAQRVQTLHLLKLKYMSKTRNAFTFLIVDVLKQSRPGYRPPVLEFKAFPPDRRLCTYTVMKEYLLRRKYKKCTETKVLVSYFGKNKAVCTSTISRWIRTVMSRAGIDTDIFKAHSTRAAVACKAKAAHVPVKDIMDKAGWSRESTFAKYYDKKVEKDRFAETILKL